jgi:D-alanyl-D-alanine dipeptidase
MDREEVVWMFWELDEEQNLVAGDFEIVNQRETGKCLDVIVLNNKTKTFEKYETVEEAVNSIPEKDIKQLALESFNG